MFRGSAERAVKRVGKDATMENPVVAGVLVALVVPFLGNTLGAALVLFARHGMSERFPKALLGFAAGVMIAASVWSLIVPALEAAEGA